MTSTMISEADVLYAMKGDQGAFARVVDGSKNVVTAIALALTCDVSDAEDVAQDAYVAAWRALPKLRNPRSFLPWMRQLTRNTARDALRKRGTERKHVTSDALLEAAADGRPGYCEEAITQEELAFVRNTMDTLPDEAREVLILFYREDRSVKHVADLLGLSEAAVKKRLSRARERLRTDLSEAFYDTLKRSAPNAALTAAVVSALSIAGPGTAAAATLSMAKAGGAVTGASLGGLALGMLSSFGAVLFGYKRGMRDAVDEQERRGIRNIAVLGTLNTIAFLGATQLPLPDLGQIAVVLLFCGTFFALYVGYLPRVIARRLAAERAADPTAEARQRKRAFMGKAGAVFGVVAAMAAVAYSLYLR